MRRVVISFSYLFLVVAAMAGIVTETDARRVAQSFRQGGARSVLSPELVHVGRVSQMEGARVVDAPTFYVYNYGEDKGFIIVSGDDCLPQILGYSDTGTFSVDEGDMPIQLVNWLQEYSNHIYNVRASVYSLEPAPDLGLDINVAVEPLLKTQWNQGAPYNSLCPAFTEDENCATGCTATAIAQIMNYHRWPDCGTGSNTHNGVVVDFSASQYDWDNMLDVYVRGFCTDEQIEAVAKLMSDIGMAVWMQYGYESSAKNEHVCRALYTYFKYSKKVRYLMRNAMTTSEWKSLIREELEAGRPVYYGGFAEDYSMGHAFVCDGIDETNNYLHFNWGWSGNCDGFYYLNTLNPPMPGIGGGMGNFNADHVAIVGIEPATEDESGLNVMPLILLRKGFQTTTSKTSLGKSFNVDVGSLGNWGPDDYELELSVGLYKDADLVCQVCDAISITLKETMSQSGMKLSVKIPVGTEAGSYELRLIHHDGNSWIDIPHYFDCYRYFIPLTVTSEGDVLIDISSSGVELAASLCDGLPVNPLPGKRYQACIDFCNVGSVNFSSRLGVSLSKLVQKAEGPSGGGTGKDTVEVASLERSEFVYGEDSERVLFDFRLMEPADYVLQAWFVDPLSLEKKIVAQWPLSLMKPSESYKRCMVIEQNGDIDVANVERFAALYKLSEQYPDQFVGVTVATDLCGWATPAYVDSLDFPAGTVAWINRQRDLGLTKAAEFEPYFLEQKNCPAIASLVAKARYTSRFEDEVEMVLNSRFAYEASKVDMRFAVVALNRTYADSLPDDYAYVDIATGFYPTNAWSGVGGIPASVNPAEEYSDTLRFSPAQKEGLILVGLLIDGETGEICNAVSLHQDDIAPADGEVKPTAVVLDHTEAVMNTGLCLSLNANVYPNTASQEIVWTSSAPDIVMFDEQGMLNTVSSGTATIRATSALDEKVYAEMVLTVNQADYTRVQHVIPGCLHYLVCLEYCPEKLLLEGELNGTDIALLRTLSGGDIANEEGKNDATVSVLKYLDISLCHIVAGGKPYYKEYYTADNVLGREVFANCICLKEICLPKNLSSIGYAPFYGCTGMEQFFISEENNSFKTVDGVLYNNTGTELVAYPASKESECYTPIETTTTIRPYAFCNARHLKHFVGLLKLSSIGYGGFYGCKSLQSVQTNTRLSTIDEYAFAGCESLMKIVSKKNYPPVCASDNVFEGVPVGVCCVYAPQDYIEDYRAEVGWRLFANYDDVANGVSVTAWDSKGVSIAVEGRTICVKGAIWGLPISLYDVRGRLVVQTFAGAGMTSIMANAEGLYFLCLPGFSAKVVVK